MTTMALVGDPPIEVNIKRSPRAKRYSLRISGTSGQVNLTMPQRAKLEEALAFAWTQEGWLRKHLSKRVAPILPSYGQALPVEGTPLVISPGSGRRVFVENGALFVPGLEDAVPGRLKGFLRTLARERLTHASTRYAELVARPYGKITLRDTRSRWGSCTTEGNLMYSWRLILAPVEVLDYVAAHEVAHLVEMNHSRAFWRTVERIYPGYEAPRGWLREKGQELHRYQF